MWGRHPKTGKPIRILQTETSISKDTKTLVWLGPQTPQNPDATWERWDVGALGLSYLTSKTDTLVLCDDANVEAEVAWLKKNKWRDLKMILASKKVLDTLGDEALKRLQIGNMICLEEAAEIYPFLGPPWKGTQTDAALIASVLLRMNCVIGLEEDPDRDVVTRLIYTEPPQLYMITQYYKPTQLARQREIDSCLKKNLDNPLIDRMILLNETQLDLPVTNAKIQQEVIGERLKYSTVIKWIAEKAPPNTYCVFANSDIYLDETWKNLWATKMEDRFLSLLRYENNELFGPRSDSQDTWVILSDSVKKRTWDYASIDFIFGKAGCDNAINIEMLRAKFTVTNPALTLKTHHLHSSQVRNYDPQDIVDKPMYFYIQPTALHDMMPIFNLKPASSLPVAPFSRQISGVKSAALKTFCTMLARNEKYTFIVDTQNLFTGEPTPIYEADKVFQTPTGLAYTYSSLFVGKTKAASEAWNKSQISALSPSLAVEVGLIAPLPDEFVANSATYVLHYLSNILLLREKAGGHGEFWSPREKPFLDALQMFNWKRQQVPVLPRDETIQVYCKKAYFMLPSDTSYLTKHQIRVLRETLLGIRSSGWIPVSPTEKCVIFYDELYCTREFINQLEDMLDMPVKVIWPETVSYLEALMGASHIIVGGDIRQWGWSWIAAKGAHVIQLQNEMEPDGDCLHLASAADLQHSLCICPKGKLQNSKALVEQVLQNVNRVSSQDTHTNPNAPLLILPKQPSESFFGHANDSFREMAIMWNLKGYVRLVEDKTAHHVWLHGIGHTLLYDRPTYEWLEASPQDEQTYKQALFGNPAPKQGGKAWSFWPRRPLLVEELASADLLSYSQRTQSLVLYGKIENATQKKRRPLNWAAACSEFVMPVGGEKAYPFSQLEYLEKLGKARFGLCLPGYGWKCHREVECMAMGCVPIVSPEVDMTNYANPPQKGVHYFVASTPEEAKALATDTEETTWKQMSAAAHTWWKENASCDGMWHLTEKLLL